MKKEKSEFIKNGENAGRAMGYFSYGMDFGIIGGVIAIGAWLFIVGYIVVNHVL